MSIEINRPKLYIDQMASPNQNKDKYGGSPEKWVNGIYRGDINSPEDRSVLIMAVLSGELAVADFGPTYGVVGNSWSPDVWDKILQAKGSKHGKPLSMLAAPEYLPTVLDESFIHNSELLGVLTDPKQIESRFAGLTFLKIPVKADELDVSFISQYTATDGATYPTANILTLPVGTPLFDEYRVAGSIAQGIDPKNVVMRVSSCNLSGRGLHGYEDNPMYIEITDIAHADQFAELSGGLVRVVLHDFASHTLEGNNSIAQDHRRGSFPIATVEQQEVLLTRQGNIPDVHVGYLHLGLPFRSDNPAVITRNYELPPEIADDEHLRYIVENNPKSLTAEGVARAVRFHTTRRLDR